MSPPSPSVPASVPSVPDPLAEFDYAVPAGLVAGRPAEQRDGARLLDIRGPKPVPRMMTDLPALLRPGDLLVVNDTRVIPARLRGEKTTGGKVEILAERLLSETRLLAQVRPARALRAGSVVNISANSAAKNAPATFPLRAEKRVGELWELAAVPESDLREVLNRFGETPLPPYIRRRPDAADAARYQTVFARNDGSVAAPTAGLHFSEALMNDAKQRGANIVPLTLHIGAGTFAPVRGHPDAHKMHSERYDIPPETAAAVNAARRERRRIVAVGTTVLRALESSALRRESETGVAKVRSGPAETDLFIRPGFVFRVAEMLLTNFHLPRSTLLMLVCAFAGRDKVLSAYQYAARNNFRFFSYGDATLLGRV